jgi:hypothetical protein
MSQNQAPYSSRPSTSLKVRPFAPFAPRMICGCGLHSEWLRGRGPLRPEPLREALPRRRLVVQPSLFFRTVSHSAVRTSYSLNPTEPKGFACEKACVWPAVPLAIPALPPILRLARAGFFTRGNIHDRPAKPSIRCLRGNSGAARRLAPRIGHTYSPASASFVSRTARSSFHSGRFSSRTLPQPLGKMAQS